MRVANGQRRLEGGTALPYCEFYKKSGRVLLLDQPSASVRLVNALPDQRIDVPSWRGGESYELRTPPGRPPQHAHFFAFSRHQSGLRQERAFYRSHQYFTGRIFLCLVVAAAGT